LNTGQHDLELKAKRASEWLKEGHRVKFDLFLIGRAKYMEKDFLKERMDRMLKFVTEEYKVADGPKKSPKGMTMILEKK
jgi:translation initiation factor IF-3